MFKTLGIVFIVSGLMGDSCALVIAGIICLFL